MQILRLRDSWHDSARNASPVPGVQALRNRHLRNVVLMHSLLGEQDGISELDTCTQPIAKGPGQLQLGYCVSYNVLVSEA